MTLFVECLLAEANVRSSVAKHEIFRKIVEVVCLNVDLSDFFLLSLDFSDPSTQRSETRTPFGTHSLIAEIESINEPTNQSIKSISPTINPTMKSINQSNQSINPTMKYVILGSNPRAKHSNFYFLRNGLLLFGEKKNKKQNKFRIEKTQVHPIDVALIKKKNTTKTL